MAQFELLEQTESKKHWSVETDTNFTNFIPKDEVSFYNFTLFR